MPPRPDEPSGLRTRRDSAVSALAGHRCHTHVAAESAQAENRYMNAPLSSWAFLGLAALGLAMTVTGLVRATRLGWGNMFWFLSGWLTSELAIFHVLLSVAVLCVFALTTGALHAI